MGPFGDAYHALAYEGAEDLSWARGPLWFGAFDVPKEMDSTINPHTIQFRFGLLKMGFKFIGDNLTRL